MNRLPSPYQSLPPPTANETAALLVALGQMLVGFRERAEDARGLAEVYATSLDDLPTWASIKACDVFKRGKVRGRATSAFAPSSAELHEHAAGLANAEYERRNAESAPPPPPRAQLRSSEEIGAERMARIRESAKAWALVPPPGDRTQNPLTDAVDAMRRNLKETEH